jgi:two-component system response regulator VanR
VPDRSRLEGATVLVVDDERDARELLAQFLGLAGVRVITASDGLQGLKRFEEQRPDAVLTDVRMPVMDGYEMSAAIRDIDPSVPIFVLSAYSGEDDPAIFEELALSAVFRKPTRPQRILEALARALG